MDKDEALGDGLDMEVRELKVLLIIPGFLAPRDGWGQVPFTEIENSGRGPGLSGCGKILTSDLNVPLTYLRDIKLIGG